MKIQEREISDYLSIGDEFVWRDSSLEVEMKISVAVLLDRDVLHIKSFIKNRTNFCWSLIRSQI